MIKMNRFGEWFLTEAGKKFAYFAAGGTATAVMCAHILPHTFLLDRYKDFIRLYKQGFSVPLTKELQDRFQKTLDLLEIDQEDRHLFKPFAAYGFDIFSAGTSYSKYGVIIGIPANFFYKDVTSVDKQSIKLRDDSIAWELEEGQLLAKSLVLSENAQIYAMAREIKFRETPKQFIDPLVAVTSVTGAYGISKHINTKFDLYARPRGLRLVLYCLVGAFTFGSYALCKDFSQVYFEEKIDRELKNLNPIFAEGGKEFYSKILQRNVALRNLLGREGERIYSALGNENYFIRYKHLPLVQRKLFFDKVDVQ